MRSNADLVLGRERVVEHAERYSEASAAAAETMCCSRRLICSSLHFRCGGHMSRAAELGLYAAQVT